MKKVLPESLDNICLVGIVLSIIEILIAVVFSLVGGVLVRAVTSKAEPGWGILGIGIAFFGLVALGFGIIRLIGYIHMKKGRFSGFIIVLISEVISFIGGLYSILIGQVFFAAIPFIWAIIVLVFLYKYRLSFKKEEASEKE